MQGQELKLFLMSGVYAGIDFGKQEWTQDQLTTISGHTAQLASTKRMTPLQKTLAGTPLRQSGNAKHTHSFSSNFHARSIIRPEQTRLRHTGKGLRRKTQRQSFDIRQGHFLSIGHSLVGIHLAESTPSWRMARHCHRRRIDIQSIQALHVHLGNGDDCPKLGQALGGGTKTHDATDISAAFSACF